MTFVRVSANVIRRADEFIFLEGALTSFSSRIILLIRCHLEVIPLTGPDPPVRKRPKTVAERAQAGEQPQRRTILDHLNAPNKVGTSNEDGPAVIMNEDGTMVTEMEDVPNDDNL